MTAGYRPAHLREKLSSFVEAGDKSGAVRGEIGASWERSARAGLRPQQFDVPHHPDIDADGLLVRASRPVLDQLECDFDMVRMSVVLTDVQADVLDRRVTEPSLNARLDGILLAPGFVYAEDSVGTNAIGTALEQRAPSYVEGEEHFADALTRMACAAAPINDPRTGRMLGAVDLTCEARDANPLMLPFIRRAARDIEQRLTEDVRLAEQVLLQRFLRGRRLSKLPGRCHEREFDGHQCGR
jgi:transcriptional regulator of acetoin/glycerol metabolism